MSADSVPVTVLHVIETLRFAGAEWVCVEICSRLERARFRPRVFTYRPGDDLAGFLERSGVPWTGALRPGRWDFSHLRRMLELVDSEEVRILHSHLDGANFWGEIASWFRRDVRHLSHVHLMSIKRLSVLGLVLRSVIARSDLVVAVCERDRRELVERHGLESRRVVTVYNGVDLRRFRPAAAGEREAVRRRLGLPGEAPVVGIVASLTPRKHHENLLQATARLERRHGVHLALVGTGPESHRDLLAAAARDLGLDGRVHFLGARSDVHEVLRAFDIGVLCSRNEAMPLTVLEYMASALPQVCTDVGGISEMLGEPQVGVLVPREDPAALGSALDALLSDPARRIELGEGARSRAEERFDILRSVRHFENLYSDLLSSAIRGRA